jgi:cytochrome c oxidase assembly protein subunit 15
MSVLLRLRPSSGLSLALRGHAITPNACKLVQRNIIPPRIRRFATTADAAGQAANDANRRVAGYWIMGTAGMVFVMVVLGGVTRLTRSGLSIVEWRPHGEVLPTNDEEWQCEFDKYKAFPEYQKVNRHMPLDEFKFIYMMEWLHRFWGRAIGIAFAGPLAYFAVRKRIPHGLWPRLLTMLGLGAAQGGVGWWMVKSGLEHERFADEYSVPRVSPYRLTTHVSEPASRTFARAPNGRTGRRRTACTFNRLRRVAS